MQPVFLQVQPIFLLLAFDRLSSTTLTSTLSIILIPRESSPSKPSNYEVLLSKHEKERRELAILLLVSISLRELLAGLMIGASRMIEQLSCGKMHLLMPYVFIDIFIVYLLYHYLIILPEIP
jgi:hypothetical protein